MTTVACRGHEFTLDAKQEEFLGTAKARRMPFVYFDCPTCGRSIKVILAESAVAPELPILRCPVAHCSGWVVNIVGKPVTSRPMRWGCGECGTTWPSDKALFAAVEAIVKRFPHRTKVYKRTSDKGWARVADSAEPKDYVALVEAEPWQD